jgi:hypothetical protein
MQKRCDRLLRQSGFQAFDGKVMVLGTEKYRPTDSYHQVLSKMHPYLDKPDKRLHL